MTDTKEPPTYAQLFEGLKYPDTVRAMYKVQFESWMTEEDKMEFILIVGKETGMLPKQIDELIQLGVDKGHSPEKQFEAFKKKGANDDI